MKLPYSCKLCGATINHYRGCDCVDRQHEVDAGVYESAVTGRSDFRKAFVIERNRAAKAEAALAEVHAVLDREIDGAKQTLAMDLTVDARRSADGWLNAAKGIQIAVNKVWPLNIPAKETV